MSDWHSSPAASTLSRKFRLQPRTGRVPTLLPCGFWKIRAVTQWHYSHDGHVGRPGNSLRLAKTLMSAAPLSRERVASFTRGAELSAYRDVEDTDEMRHRHKMAQAKIRGSSTTRRPRYAAIPAIIRICPHAMPVPLLCTYSQLSAALAEIDVLISQTPNSPWLRTQGTGQLRSRTGCRRSGGL